MLVLVFVLLILLVYSWFFRGDHDTIVSNNQWISGVIGGILTLVTGKVAQAVQQSTISNSRVSQVVEKGETPSTQ